MDPSINDQRQIAIDEAGKVVDGIQVGGVNILIGSTTGTGWTGYTEHKDTEFSIKDASTRESYIRSAMITIPGNKEIVVSFTQNIQVIKIILIFIFFLLLILKLMHY